MRKKVTVTKLATLQGHTDSVYALTGDENGFVYSSGGDGMIVQWDLSKPKDGLLIAKLESSVYALAYDIDTKHLFIGHNYEGLHVIDPITKQEIFDLKLENVSSIFDIKIKGDDVFLASKTGSLYIVNKHTKDLKIIKVSNQSLRSIQFVENGYLIGSSDQKVYLLNNDFKIIYTGTEATKSVFDVGQSIHGIYTVSRDCHLRKYNNRLELQSDVVAHMYAINAIEFSPEEQYFATASQDKTLKVWDSETNKLLKVIDYGRHGGHQNSVNKLFWSRYGNLLLSCSDDRTLIVWQLEIES